MHNVFTMLAMFHFSSECLDDIPEIQYSSNNWASDKSSSKAVDTVVTYTCLADTSKTVTARCDQAKFRWLADSMECPKPAGLFIHTSYKICFKINHFRLY